MHLFCFIQDDSDDTNSTRVTVDFNDDIFHFTLASSLADFWNSGAYTLAILLGAFSGVWPYVKLLGLLLAWLYPMSIKLRERLLLFLDLFGKYYSFGNVS